MPFWPGTGIPKGISPFAFSAGAAEAGRTVGVNFSSLAGFDGSSIGVGTGSVPFDSREVARRESRAFFLLGIGVG